MKVLIFAIVLVGVAAGSHLLGGYSREKDPTKDIDRLFESDNCKQAKVLEKVAESWNGDICDPKVISYSTQIVAGINYRLVVDMCEDKFAKVTIFKPLPYTGNPATLTSVVPLK